MSELAFNYKNRRFTPKSDAVSWLVERLRDGQRGQLDAVMNDEGAPLTAPIATTPRSAFRALVKNQPGRYRLTQLDADMMPIEDAETAYVTVPPVESRRAIDEDGEAEPVVYDDGPAAHRATAPAPAYRNAAPAPSVPATITAPFGTWPALPIPTALSGTEYLLAEALRGQVQMFQVLAGALADRSATNATGASEMMTAAAELLRAADGASMPRREPPPTAPTPPAAPVPPPTPASAPTVVYAMPRNAAFADDGYEDDVDDEEDSEDDDDDAAPIDATEEDFFAKANKLVAKVAEAIAPVASVAQIVMGAGLGGLGGMFGGGGGDGTRNAADTSAPAANSADAPDDDEPADPMLAHLRTSHVLAVSHELGANDGSIFRHMLRAMEPADRRMLVERLCSMPLDEAVPYAAEKVSWLKARMRSRARCAPPAEHVDADPAMPEGLAADDHTADVPDDDDPNQEHDTTQHDDDARDHADDHADQEHDTTQHDDADDEYTHPDDQEYTRDPQLDHLAETVVPTGDERMTAAPTALATTTVYRSPMPASTPATIPATVIASTEVPRPLTPDVAAHMQRIAKHLTFREILAAKSLINDTSIAERNSWIARLMALEPTEAATAVRTELARRAGRTS